MKVLGIYLLQLIAASAILYGYYHFFLKNKKFHQYNRYYLLAAIIISIFVPFLQIPFYFTQEEADASALLKTLKTIYYSEGDSVVVMASGANYFDWNLVPFIIYGVIAAVLLGKIIFSVWKVKQIIKAHPSEELEGVHFVNTAEPGTPFSFFRWLFWNKDIELRSEQGQKIFRHEIFHIQQKHSWDVLFAEFISMLLWINPFFHIIKKEIRAIHEFLADEFASKEEDKWEYAELLLMQALQTKQNLVTPFFHNQIKRRIAMITNSQKTSHRYLRKLLALPLTILVVMLLAFTYKNKNIEENKAAELDNLLSSSVIDTTSKDVKEAITLLGAVMEKEPGQAVVFKGINDTTEMPLIIVDNVKMKDKALLAKMNPDNIESMTVFKGETAMERYGKDGENGVINIITKNSGILATPTGSTLEMRKADNNELKGKVYEIKINPTDTAVKPLTEKVVTGYRIRSNSSSDNNTNPLIVVNGVKLPKGTDLNRMDPANIESITVLKDASATSMYGIDGADGAIQITTKDKTPLKFNNIPVERKVMVADGFIIDTASPNQLKEVTVVGYGRPVAIENKIFEQAEQPATFPGGDAAWRKFLERQLNANVAIDNKAPVGTYYAIVQFVVHSDGSVSDIKALTDNGYGVEEEAIRVISKGPKWQPAVQNGKEVPSIRKQRITFVVNDETKPGNPELKEVVVVGYGTSKGAKSNVATPGTAQEVKKQPSIDNLSTIYPNPSTNKVTVLFEALTAGKGEIRITDMSGNLKMTNTTNLAKGKNNIDVSVSSLANGTYIISLKGAGDDKTAVYKVVKQ